MLCAERHGYTFVRPGGSGGVLRLALRGPLVNGIMTGPRAVAGALGNQRRGHRQGHQLQQRCTTAVASCSRQSAHHQGQCRGDNCTDCAVDKPASTSRTLQRVWAGATWGSNHGCANASVLCVDSCLAACEKYRVTRRLPCEIDGIPNAQEAVAKGKDNKTNGLGYKHGIGFAFVHDISSSIEVFRRCIFWGVGEFSRLCFKGKQTRDAFPQKTSFKKGVQCAQH